MALDHHTVIETFEDPKRRILGVVPTAIVQLSGGVSLKDSIRTTWTPPLY
jgi:hypothetical protein